MFDDFKVVNYPKSLPSPEAYARHMSRMFTGDIIDGFTVTPGTGLQVVLAPGNAMIRYGSAAVASARMVSLVNNFSLAIDVADVSNPRIDLVVLYVDNAVDLPGGTPTAANLDGKGVAKAKIVKGTAAAVPAKPNATAIQASVGAGNPYSVVAEVRVDAGVSVIAANKVADSRAMSMLQVAKLDSATFPKFKARRVAPLNFLRSSTSIYAVDTIEYNIGGGALSGGRYTVPIKGTYRVTAKLIIADNPVTAWATLYINGLEHSYQQFEVSGNYPNMRVDTSVELNAGDIVDVRILNESTTRDPAISIQSHRPRANELVVEYLP